MQTRRVPNEKYIKAIESHIGRGIKIKVETISSGYLGQRFEIKVYKGKKVQVARFVVRTYFDCGTLLINDYSLIDSRKLYNMFGGHIHISTVKKAVSMLLDFYTHSIRDATIFSEGQSNNSSGYNLLSTVDRGNPAFTSFIDNFDFERLVDFTNPNYIDEQAINRRSIVMLCGKQEYLTTKYPFLSVTVRKEREQREKNRGSNFIKWG